jgi:hypothetical protein
MIWITAVTGAVWLPWRKAHFPPNIVLANKGIVTRKAVNDEPIRRGSAGPNRKRSVTSFMSWTGNERSATADDAAHSSDYGSDI